MENILLMQHQAMISFLQKKNRKLFNLENMKPFNLEEYLKKPGIKVVTRDGRAVKIHCTNYDSRQPIIAQIESHNCSRSFTEDGRYYNSDRISPYDLFFAPENHEGWINIFKSSNDIAFLGQCCVFESKEDAEKHGKDLEYYVATVKVEWEE